MVGEGALAVRAGSVKRQWLGTWSFDAGESYLAPVPDRPYHVHNAAITVVRTKQNEIEILAESVAGLCNNAQGPIKILVPMNGFSAFDHEDGPLHDPGAPAIFLNNLKKNLDDDSCLEALPYHINDSDFARAVIDRSYRIISDIF